MTARLMIACWLLLTLVACTSAQPAPTQRPALSTPQAATLPVTHWPSLEMVAAADTREAPAVLRVAGGSVFTWTGVQENEARHFSRGVNGNVQIMALRAFFPQQQQLFPAQDGVLLLWLDRTPDNDTLRLQSAIFSRDGIAEIDALPISTARTLHYSAVQDGTGFVTLVWSGGLGAVNDLYLSQVDDNGRPLGNTPLRVDASHPALIATPQGLRLYWLEDRGRAVYTGLIVRGDGTSTLDAVQRVTRADRLRVTDAIESFAVGFDGADVTLFWHIRQLDGRSTVLFSSGTPDAASFSEPRPLGFQFESGDSVSSFLPLTQVQRVRYVADDGLRWARPFNGQGDGLPVIVNWRGEVGILLLRDGVPVAYESIAMTGDLLAPPTLYRAADGHLSVTWAQPVSDAPARLYHASTRPE